MGTVHFQTNGNETGYIRNYPTFACGIEGRVTTLELGNLGRTTQESWTTCEWCKIALDEKLNEPVTQRQLNQIDDKIEAAITRGVEKAVERISKDFREAKAPLGQLVADGVEKALQRGSVKQNLVGIHKIAEDEIDAEWDESGRDDEIAEDRQREIKDALREVLEEAAPGQTGAGVGTTFNQTVVSPASLTPHDVYEAVREAIADDDDETLEDYEEHETALMQKAVTSIVTSDEFQELIKKLVKVSIEEISDQTPLVHHRRLYTARTSCGLPGGSLKTEFRPSKANCVDCDAALNKN